MDTNPARLDQRNLPERVAELLLTRVSTGAIAVGSRIAELPLSKELGISRSTLREGLRLLEARGIVESFPQKGSYVRRCDQRSIGTIYATRETLELRAFDHLLAKPQRLSDLLPRLRRIAESMQEYDDHSREMLNKLDIEFHTTLIEAAEDCVLSSIWRAIKDHLTVIFSLEWVDGREYRNDHQAIIEALTRGDKPSLVAEYRRHVLKGRLNVE
jgi:DNA-binding GntR family transcriptional regulator